MADDLGDFHGEAREILDGIAADLVRLEKTPADADLVNRIFRGAHSLKGLAGMLGFPAVSQMAHKVESVLDAVRMGRVKPDAATLDVLLAANELLVRMVDGAREGDPGRERAAAAAMAERLAALAAKAPEATGPKRRIDPELARVLSEYEEHRLDDALAKGKRPWKIEVAFPFESFDRDLPALKERLKPYGEVITTMAGDLSAADKMGFGLLVVSAKDPSVLLVAAAIPDAKVLPVAVIDDAAPAPAAPSAGGGAFQGFSATPTSWGVAELPSSPASAVSSKIAELDWNALSKEGDLEATPLFAAAAAPAPVPPPEKPRAPEGASTLRVNLERIDGLMTLVGELVTAKNAIGRVAERLQAEKGPRAATLEVFKVKRTLERRLDELQKGILQVRMLPLGDLFTRLTRVVRNLSRESGKEIDLLIEGAETELDKVMIDELSDPLIHIVRNAVDHGIEAPAERVAAGKPAKGTLAIRAYPKGSHVAIELSDDGGGLDTARIKAKAIQKGMLAPDAEPSREELFDLIFAPGFSTKETVSEVSGRGVGMDVVRNNIMKLSGMIDTRSEHGKGTTFTITLPLTLAIMKALVVETAGQTYAVPLASVLECVAVRPAEVRIDGDRESVALRDLTIPIVRVARFFGLDEMPLPEEEQARARLHIVVVGVAQYRVGLAVERLGGQQDVVVKPLGAPLARLKGIMGATNLGNDRPVLVLDVAGLVGSSVAGRLQEAS